MYLGFCILRTRSLRGRYALMRGCGAISRNFRKTWARTGLSHQIYHFDGFAPRTLCHCPELLVCACLGCFILTPPKLRILCGSQTPDNGLVELFIFLSNDFFKNTAIDVDNFCRRMRSPGIEPGLLAWKAKVIPLDHDRSLVSLGCGWIYAIKLGMIPVFLLLCIVRKIIFLRAQWFRSLSASCISSCVCFFQNRKLRRSFS